MNFLEKIVIDKRKEIDELKRRIDLAQIREEALSAPPPRDFRGALATGVSLIAEVKRRSPSRGRLATERSAGKLARIYQENGARAVSVLTDREHFGGSLRDLMEVKEKVGIPVLRKDFLIDPVQIYESRARGADAVLLIVAILEDSELARMAELAAELGLSALVEVHTVAELERASRLSAGLIGINNRDLSTFDIDLKTGIRLLRNVPPGAIAVAESGIMTDFDISRLARAGFRTFLVGEALVTAADPGEKLERLIQAAKTAAEDRVNAG